MLNLFLDVVFRDRIQFYSVLSSLQNGRSVDRQLALELHYQQDELYGEEVGPHLLDDLANSELEHNQKD